MARVGVLGLVEPICTSVSHSRFASDVNRLFSQ